MKIVAFTYRTIDTIPVPREFQKFGYDLLTEPVVMTAHCDDGRTYSKYHSDGGDFPSEAKAYFAALQPKESNP